MRGVSWSSFRTKFSKWREAQRKHMPTFEAFVQTDDAEDDRNETDEGANPTFDEVFALPSDFTTDELEEYEITHLVQFELALRVGLAFDQLDGLRKTVRHRASLIGDKISTARGQKVNKDAQEHIQRIKTLAVRLSEVYNDNFSRIERLRGKAYNPSSDPSPGARLRKVVPESDLTLANLDVRVLGDSKVTASWIWEVFEPATGQTTKRQSNGAKTYAAADEHCELIFNFKALNVDLISS